MRFFLAQNSLFKRVFLCHEIGPLIIPKMVRLDKNLSKKYHNTKFHGQYFFIYVHIQNYYVNFLVGLCSRLSEKK